MKTFPDPIFQFRRNKFRQKIGVTGDTRTALDVRNWMAAAQNKNNPWKLVEKARTGYRVVAPSLILYLIINKTCSQIRKKHNLKDNNSSS